MADSKKPTINIDPRDWLTPAGHINTSMIDSDNVLPGPEQENQWPVSFKGFINPLTGEPAPTGLANNLQEE